MLDRAINVVSEFLFGNEEIVYPPDDWRRDLDWARISTSWLEHEAYDSEREIFYLNNDVGFMVEVVPQTGCDESTIETLLTILVGAQVGMNCQVQAFADHCIDRELESYLKSRVTRIGQEGAKKRVGWIHSIQNSGEENDFRIMRRFRCFVSGTVAGTSEGSIKRLQNMRNQVESSLASAMFAFRRYDAQDLIQILHRFMNPQIQDVVPIPYDPYTMIKYQAVNRDTKAIVQKNEVLFDDAYNNRTIARAYSVQRYPQKFAMWQMHAKMPESRSW